MGTFWRRWCLGPRLIFALKPDISAVVTTSWAEVAAAWRGTGGATCPRHVLHGCGAVGGRTRAPRGVLNQSWSDERG